MRAPKPVILFTDEVQVGHNPFQCDVGFLPAFRLLASQLPMLEHIVIHGDFLSGNLLNDHSAVVVGLSGASCDGHAIALLEYGICVERERAVCEGRSLGGLFCAQRLHLVRLSIV